MKFRKKPVVVEAVQFQPEYDPSSCDGIVFDGELHAWVIQTLEGKMICSVGDWIVTGIAGERYPCKPGIFMATYEAAE